MAMELTVANGEVVKTIHLGKEKLVIEFESGKRLEIEPLIMYGEATNLVCLKKGEGK